MFSCIDCTYTKQKPLQGGAVKLITMKTQIKHENRGK